MPARKLVLPRDQRGRKRKKKGQWKQPSERPHDNIGSLYKAFRTKKNAQQHVHSKRGVDQIALRNAQLEIGKQIWESILSSETLSVLARYCSR